MAFPQLSTIFVSNTFSHLGTTLVHFDANVSQFLSALSAPVSSCEFRENLTGRKMYSLSNLTEAVINLHRSSQPFLPLKINSVII